MVEKFILGADGYVQNVHNPEEQEAERRGGARHRYILQRSVCSDHFVQLGLTSQNLQHLLKYHNQWRTGCSKHEPLGNISDQNILCL